MCTLIDLLLDIVSIETYAEVSVEHLPKLFQSMVASISRDILNLDGGHLERGLGAVKRVLERIMSALTVWEENRASGGSGAAHGVRKGELLEEPQARLDHITITLCSLLVGKKFYWT